MASIVAASSVTKEVVFRLSEHFRDNMPALKQVLENWPNANDNLLYPSLSITPAGSPSFSAEPPYVLSQEPSSSPKAKVLYVVGEYDFNFQLDFWTGSQAQRHAIFENFFEVFHADFPNTMGIGLILEDYHGIVCRYDMTGYDYGDEESSAQRREWRVKANLVANCFAAMSLEQATMTNITLDDEFINQFEFSGGNS